MLTSKQWVKIAEHIDSGGTEFICHAAEHLGLNIAAVENWLLQSIEGSQRNSWGFRALADLDPLNPEGPRLTGQEYADAKVMLCLLFAAMSPEDMAEFA